MLASIFGRKTRSSGRKKNRNGAPAAPQEVEVKCSRKRKRPAAESLAPSSAPSQKLQLRSTTSGAARRRQAKEKAAATGTPSDKVAGLEAVKDSLTEPAPSAPAVEIFGKDASEFKPWDTFELVQQGSAKAKLPQVLISYMAKFKAFKEPTAIQAYCWPLACAGRQVVGISKTGSGKTLAFLLPALQRVLAFKFAKTPSFGPYALILTPTRELALQIARDAAGLCKATGIKMACLYGGTSKGDQIKSLHFGVDQLICTPGRLDDLVSKPDKFTGQADNI